MLEGSDLAERVADLLGVPRLESGDVSPTELAKAVGLTGMHAPQSARRWLRGRNGPAYEGTIALLDAAGFITPTGRAFLELPARPGEREADMLREAKESADAARAADLSGGLREPRRGAA